MRELLQPVGPLSSQSVLISECFIAHTMTNANRVRWLKLSWLPKREPRWILEICWGINPSTQERKR